MPTSKTTPELLSAFLTEAESEPEDITEATKLLAELTAAIQQDSEDAERWRELNQDLSQKFLERTWNPREVQ